MRVLIVTAVQVEADAIGPIENAQIIVSGIGRTNAAAATTEAIIKDGPFDYVISAGLAGSLPGPGLLPGAGLEIGDIVVASVCVYVEEGLHTPDGFQDMDALGFSLGGFEGNAVPVDPTMLVVPDALYRTGPIATVATCSGTDEAAREVVRRTGAIAEAMEGAAVVHAAHRLGIPAGELRAISNTTGDRNNQRWDMPRGLSALGDAVRAAMSQPALSD